MVVDERLQALLEQGEELGCLNLSAISEFLQEAELDDDQTTGFFEQLEERGIVLTDDCARRDAVENTSDDRPVRQLKISFNSATAVTPWRTYANHSHELGRFRASIRPRR